jgi:hypothetical protein
LDNDTLLAFANDGRLLEVNPATLETTQVANVSTPVGTSKFSALAYNPDVSPYIYASFSTFSDPATVNKLYVLDPANSYSLLNTIDLSGSLQTAREIALDEDGNLFMGAFRGAVEFIPAANVLNPATLTNDSTVDWLAPLATGAAFTGLDIGFGTGAPTASADFDNDLDVDGADFLAFQRLFGSTDPTADFDGNGVVDNADTTIFNRQLFEPVPPAAAAAAAVPEPGSLVLAALGLAAGLGMRRRG